MEPVSVNLTFLDELVRYETTIWNAVDRALIGAGTTSLAVLFSLRHLQGRGDRGRVQDLAAHLGVTVGAASKIVDRLERDGLAERRPHPDDRRSSLISLTAAGVEALAEAHAAADGVLGNLLPDPVRTAEVTALLRTMHGDLTATRAEPLR